MSNASRACAYRAAPNRRWARPELHLVAGGSLFERLPRVERADLAGGDRREIAQRKLEVDVRVRPRRRRGGLRRPASRAPAGSSPDRQPAILSRSAARNTSPHRRSAAAAPRFRRRGCEPRLGRYPRGSLIDQRSEGCLRFVEATGAEGEQPGVGPAIRRQRRVRRASPSRAPRRPRCIWSRRSG